MTLSRNIQFKQALFYLQSDHAKQNECVTLLYTSYTLYLEGPLSYDTYQLLIQGRVIFCPLGPPACN